MADKKKKSKLNKIMKKISEEQKKKGSDQARGRTRVNIGEVF